MSHLHKNTPRTSLSTPKTLHLLTASYFYSNRWLIHFFAFNFCWNHSQRMVYSLIKNLKEKKKEKKRGKKTHQKKQNKTLVLLPPSHVADGAVHYPSRSTVKVQTAQDLQNKPILWQNQNQLSPCVYWWVSAGGIIFREWKLASREQSEGSGGFWVWALHVTHTLLDCSSSSPRQRHNPGCSPELRSPLLFFCPRTGSRDCLKDLVIWCLCPGASPIPLSVPQVRHLNPSPSRSSGWQWEEFDSCRYCCHQ